uniref:Uncharacterized protein n=1 Tax=Anguilla anguilla TaxID=7936 RepID=A0A0E9U1Z1_ANGAN
MIMLIWPCLRAFVYALNAASKSVGHYKKNLYALKPLLHILLQERLTEKLITS